MRRKTLIVTGLMGSGKSAVCALLRERGIPVYNADARTKALYARRPSLVPLMEQALGQALRRPDGPLDRQALAARIFADAPSRERVEALVYPLVLQDFRRWRSRCKGAAWVALESAVILSKPLFDGLADAAVEVTAPLEVRLQRVMRRDGLSREEALARMAVQGIPAEKVTFRIPNDGSPEALARSVKQVISNIIQ